LTVKIRHLLLSSCLLIIFINSYAESKECIHSVNDEVYCTAIEYKPFGKFVITKNFNNKGELVFARYEGAYSGVYLFPDISVYYSEENGWWLGNLNKILFINLSTNNIYTFQINGEMWHLNISEITFPINLRGIATESVNRISFTIYKVIELNNSSNINLLY